MEKYINIAKGSLSLIIMISFLVAIIIPLAPFVIDMAIVLSMAIAIVVYMRASTIEEWDELKTFPTILLLTAIFRIALNISTTRKILHDGEPGTVIEAAGNYIVGSNVWVGFVVFIILIVVQFIIANGASRTAEVNARFTLDGMPMKQMSIDNDLNNGAIDQEEASERRKKLDMEVDFYGNMDGAGKFIKGDVIAGIILFLVNIIFGFIIGVVVQGMPMADAAYRYTILTIGDGLVNQISSLLLAVGAGVVMTRVYGGEKENVTQGIFSELTKSPIVIYVVGALFLFIAIFTELPFLPFALIGAFLFYIGYRKSAQLEKADNVVKQEELLKEQEMQSQENEKVEVDTEIEPITLELGIALIPLAEDSESEKENLQDKIRIMRQVIAKELGVKIPQIHVVDNSALDPYEKYRIRIKDSVIAEGVLRMNKVLALKTPYVVNEDLNGEPTKDPIFGEDAFWISQEDANEAKDSGYMVYDTLSILSTHLNEIVRKNLFTLLQRQEVRDLLDQVGQKHKVLIDEIEKEEISLSLIQRVLQNLLRESLSIRDLPTILESLIDGYPIVEGNFDAQKNNKIDELTGIVRERISKYICEKNKNNDGKLHVILLNEEIERSVQTAPRYDGYYLLMNIIEERKLIGSLIQQVQRAQMAEIEPILFTSRVDLRFALARLVQKYNIPINVLSANELVSDVMVEQLGIVELSDDEEQAI